MNRVEKHAGLFSCPRTRYTVSVGLGTCVQRVKEHVMKMAEYDVHSCPRTRNMMTM